MSEALRYVSGLFAPVQSKPRGRNVWGIDLETVWLPLLIASNVNGDSAISHEALGCPVRLALTKDGEVRFGANGKPVTRVHKEVSGAVSVIKQNMVAELMQYTAETRKAKPDEYKKATVLCREAGQPIAERESTMATEALQAIREAEEALAKAQAEGKAQAQAQAKAQDGKAQAKTRETAGVAS